MSYDDGYIDRPAELAQLVDDLRGERVVAVDMESNGFFRYPEFICLIQIGFGGRQFIVDPIALRDVSPLLEVFADPGRLILLHACSYDVSSFKRDYDCEFGNLFDTAIAAAFLGFERLGLDSVLKDALGVDVPKNKKLQRCDWTRRPLTSEQISYAKSDVAFLIELYSIQKSALDELGRLDWVEEECDRAKLLPPPLIKSPEESFRKTKNLRSLSPLAVSIFKELFILRDALAREKGVPPFKTLSNDTLMNLSARCAERKRPPDGSIRLPRRYIEPVANAVRRGLANGPLNLSSPRYEPRMDGSQKSLLKKLKRYRSDLGEKLKLDPSLLWPVANLEKLACATDRVDAERIMEDDDVRRWQRREFAGPLLKFLESHR